MKPLPPGSRASLTDQGASLEGNPTRRASARWLAVAVLYFALGLGSFSFRLIQHLLSQEWLPPWLWLIAFVAAALTVCSVCVGIYLWRK